MKKVIPLISFLLISCSQNKYEPIIFEYPEEKIINWKEALSQQDNIYYVYYFNNECGYCLEIKQEMLSYYYEKNPSIYFVNTKNGALIKQGSENIIGIYKIEDFYILGTPSLIKVVNYIVVDYYGGVHNIKKFISEN